MSRIGFVAGARAVPDAIRLLRREPSLRGPALLPIALSIAALGAATAGVVAYAPDIYGSVIGWWPSPSIDAWYEWIWLGPIRLVRTLIGAVLFALAAAASLAVSFLIAGLAAGPFHDVLSRRAEQVESGAVVDRAASGFTGAAREAAAAFAADLGRLTIFFAIQGAILVGGLVVPGAQVFVGPLLMIVTALFLPLEYGSFALDRRALGLRGKLAWLRAHQRAALGFGGAGLLLCAVPVVNLVALPVLVVAGTLLVLRAERG